MSLSISSAVCVAKVSSILWMSPNLPFQVAAPSDHRDFVYALVTLAIFVRNVSGAYWHVRSIDRAYTHRHMAVSVPFKTTRNINEFFPCVRKINVP